MIVAAIIIGAFPAVVTRLRRGCVVTPDGLQYARMGRGEGAPRPYSLRLVAQAIPNTTEAWTVVSSAGLVMSIIAVYVYTLHVTCQEFTAFSACALWGALPYTRRLLHWPVLTDALALGLVGMIGVMALQGGVWIVPAWGLIALGFMVHERVTVHGALLAWFVTGSYDYAVPMVAGLIMYATMYKLTKPHADEVNVRYLANPLNAWRDHRKVFPSYAHWLLPWGVFVLCATNASWQLGVVALASYAPMVVSMDRVRTYQANPYPFVIATMAVLPAEWWIPAYLFHLSISDGVI